MHNKECECLALYAQQRMHCTKTITNKANAQQQHHNEKCAAKNAQGRM
jgi:BioD-like phosphotransacetylase family protein